MKILFLKDKDYEKIIDYLSDDYRWKELLELFQESVVIPTDNELISVGKDIKESFDSIKASQGMNNDEALMKLIDVYWSSWD